MTPKPTSLPVTSDTRQSGKGFTVELLAYVQLQQLSYIDKEGEFNARLRRTNP
jgi:hypothetical protein